MGIEFGFVIGFFCLIGALVFCLLLYTRRSSKEGPEIDATTADHHRFSDTYGTETKGLAKRKPRS